MRRRNFPIKRGAVTKIPVVRSNSSVKRSDGRKANLKGIGIYIIGYKIYIRNKTGFLRCIHKLFTPSQKGGKQK
jgi:ribosomal protein L14